ncbi:MAG: hypothetical protein Q8N31_23380 [Reyranella sp.]|nr:hypothetical protein [Reyranella sp.]MDP3162966.1 hypothetical protein [Reyranella sp.]
MNVQAAAMLRCAAPRSATRAALSASERAMGEKFRPIGRISVVEEKSQAALNIVRFLLKSP